MELPMDERQQQLHRQLEKALNQGDKELVEIILNQHAARLWREPRPNPRRQRPA
jgi:hypothetical protein